LHSEVVQALPHELIRAQSDVRHPQETGMSATYPISATDLLTSQPEDMRSELLRGRLMVRDPGAYGHGKHTIAIGAALLAWVAPRQLGDVVGAETGFLLRRDPDTVRAPGAAFISAARVPRTDIGFAELGPDLVVEVLSPSDRPGHVREKVADWIAAGTLLVWLIDSAQHQAIVHRADGTVSYLGVTDVLSGESVLPGFELPLRTLIAQY
jgi:Uma2 family endonuclease